MQPFNFRVFKLVFLLVSFTTFTITANAQSNNTSKVATIIPHVGDQVFFRLTSSVQGLPACATTLAHPFRIDLSTESGQAMYAMLLAASFNDKEVQVFGNGECSGGTRENVRWIAVSP